MGEVAVALEEVVSEGDEGGVGGGGGAEGEEVADAGGFVAGVCPSGEAEEGGGGGAADAGGAVNEEEAGAVAEGVGEGENLLGVVEGRGNLARAAGVVVPAVAEDLVVAGEGVGGVDGVGVVEGEVEARDGEGEIERGLGGTVDGDEGGGGGCSGGAEEHGGFGVAEGEEVGGHGAPRNK